MEFINKKDCAQCEHGDICKFTKNFKEATGIIETMRCTLTRKHDYPDIFKIEIDCAKFKTKPKICERCLPIDLDCNSTNTSTFGLGGDD